jgi:tetratricopeptide (TPR) repeat protein
MQALKMKKVKQLKLLVIMIVALTLVNQHFSSLSAAVSYGSLSSADSLVSEGNRHYMDREYDLAVKCYSKVIEMGYESGELYYNLGNAYYKQENLPWAILNYEKALLLKPGNEDIRQNLALANARIVDKIDSIPDFFLHRWVNYFQGLFSPDGWAIISLILFMLALTTFLVYFERQIQRKENEFFIGYPPACAVIYKHSVYAEPNTKTFAKRVSYHHGIIGECQKFSG